YAAPGLRRDPSRKGSLPAPAPIPWTRLQSSRTFSPFRAAARAGHAAGLLVLLEVFDVLGLKCGHAGRGAHAPCGPGRRGLLDFLHHVALPLLTRLGTPPEAIRRDQAGEKQHRSELDGQQVWAEERSPDGACIDDLAGRRGPAARSDQVKQLDEQYGAEDRW